MKKISILLAAIICIGFIPNAYAKPPADIEFSSELVQKENYVIDELPEVNISYKTDSREYELKLSTNFYKNIDIIKMYPTNGEMKKCTYSFPVMEEGTQRLKVEILKNGTSVHEDNYVIDYIESVNDGFGYGNRGFVTHFIFEPYTQNDTYLYEAMGAEVFRDDFYWATIEKEKGVYDFSLYDEKYKGIFDTGIDMLAIVNGRNAIYKNSEGTTDIKEPAQFEGYANYALAIAKHYPNIKKFELYNEPGFDYTGSEYTKFALAAAKKLKEFNPEIEVYAGCVITDSRAKETGSEFMKNFYTDEIYPYIDGVSFHMYGNNYYAGTNIFYNQANDYMTQIRGKGGWKDVALTETGWFTLQSGVVTEEIQASELVKRAVISDSLKFPVMTFYDFKNDGEDNAESEHNFGLMNIDYSMKKSYYSMKEYLKNVRKAQYLGEVSLADGIEAYAYVANDDYFLIAWSPNTDSELKIPNRDNNGVAHTFAHENVVIKDMYGKKKGNTCLFENMPVYVHNLSPEFIMSRIKAPDIDADVFSGYSVDGMSEKYELILTDKNMLAVENFLNECYDVGNEIISDYKKGKITAMETSELLSRIDKIADSGKALAACVTDTKIYMNKDGLKMKYGMFGKTVSFEDLKLLVYLIEPYNRGRKLLSMVSKYNEGDKNGIISGDGFSIDSKGILKVKGKTNSKLVSMKVLKNGKCIYFDTLIASENTYSGEYELPEFGDYTLQVNDGAMIEKNVSYYQNEYTSVEDKMSYVNYLYAEHLLNWSETLTNTYLCEEKNVILPDDINKDGNIITFTDTDDESVIFAAVYKNGQLVRTNIENDGVCTIEYSKGEKLKLFRWNNLLDMIPKSQVIEITE